MKFTEGYWAEPEKRLFDIKINDVVVSKSLDLVKMGDGKRCVAIDIVILFLVENGQKEVHLKGYSANGTIPIENAGFVLNFCNAGESEVGVSDISFQASAYSLARFGADTDQALFDGLGVAFGTSGKACQDYNADPAACKSDGCQFDEEKKECVAGTTGKINKYIVKLNQVS